MTIRRRLQVDERVLTKMSGSKHPDSTLIDHDVEHFTLTGRCSQSHEFHKHPDKEWVMLELCRTCSPNARNGRQDDDRKVPILILQRCPRGTEFLPIPKGPEEPCDRPPKKPPNKLGNDRQLSSRKCLCGQMDCSSLRRGEDASWSNFSVGWW